MKLIITLLLIVSVNYSYAQMDTTVSGNLMIIQDTAVSKLMNARIITMRPKTMKGFRLQLASSANRNEINNLKTQFLQAHSNVRAYITYQQPYFKLRVGDFEQRTDANSFMNDIYSSFPGFIVPDIINTDGIKKEDQQLSQTPK